MFIVNIVGGLGNQMFQYALGRMLSIKNNDDLLLDISDFSDYKLREFRLDCFNCIVNIASEAQKSPFLKNKRRRRGLRRLIYPLTYNKKYPFIKESRHDYMSNIMGLTGSAYLKGYWQSEKYFKSIRGELLKDFVLRGETGLFFQSISKLIGSFDCSASVHVRRGDYVAGPNAAGVNFVCPVSYYKQAAQYLQQRYSDLHYFVFTDDPVWVRENLHFLDNCRFVSGDGDLSDCEELILMSQCRFNIIANSSFSWWAAWLNNNKDKEVIAPGKWFLDNKLNTDDIIPDEWVKLSM